jgi:NADH:ubiquinone oxidoreductase subunit K
MSTFLQTILVIAAILFGIGLMAWLRSNLRR